MLIQSVSVSDTQAARQRCRVHRHKGRAVRRNIAEVYPSKVERFADADPCAAMFAVTSAELGPQTGEEWSRA